jgi:peroxiredoxin
MLQVGTQAPDFTLSGSRERTVTLSKRSSPYTVVVFYPKNNTPG